MRRVALHLLVAVGVLFAGRAAPGTAPTTTPAESTTTTSTSTATATPTTAADPVAVE
jgi:hypothetical protein